MPHTQDNYAAMYENPEGQVRYSAKTSPLLNQVRQTIRLKHYSRSTEDSYLHNFIYFPKLCILLSASGS